MALESSRCVDVVLNPFGKLRTSLVQDLYSSDLIKSINH